MRIQFSASGSAHLYESLKSRWTQFAFDLMVAWHTIDAGCFIVKSARTQEYNGRYFFTVS